MSAARGPSKRHMWGLAGPHGGRESVKEKPLHHQHPELRCQVCAGAGNVYQFGHVIQCHVCRGAGVTEVPRNGYGEVIGRD